MVPYGPSRLPYKLLKQVTNNFDKEQILGIGGFGTVYKGADESGREIAVKLLHNTSAGLEDTEFQREFENLRGLKHQNIVELVGFCNELVEEPAVFEGKQVTAVCLRTALCFEYVHGGSLHKHISDESTGLNWHTRYRIIKGVCDGLKYLHEGLESPIMHFDLKPDNILLDKNMTPKIADFGLSRLFGEENTKKTMSSVGTCGYWPPEYIKHQIISREFDIFSLGVIIVKIMTGHKGYNTTVEMTTWKAVTLVHESWKKKLRETMSHTSLEVYCNQVKRCIEISLDCLKLNRQQRPTINDIISSLNETETMIGDHGLHNKKFYNQDDGESSSTSDNSPTISSGSSFSSSSSENFLRVDLLRSITDGFSEERLIGRGRHGNVYKGVWEDGHINVVVKRLNHLRNINDELFRMESLSLQTVQHQNIVQFVGSCSEIRTQRVGQIFVEGIKDRVICLEYLPNGSLDRYISKISSGLHWRTRYRIIKGTCEGLRYLHHNQALPQRFYHLNLKPSKILLDDNMIPKIGGFGMSRLYGGEHILVGAANVGSFDYMPPEFIERQVITAQYDIYSLGVVIIQIMTGDTYRLASLDMSSKEFIELVHDNWRKRLLRTAKGESVEGYCQLVEACLKIALMCVEPQRHQRPTLQYIIDTLNKTEMLIKEQVLHRELLDVHPLKLCFLPSVPSSSESKNKKSIMISCSLQLKNWGDDRVAFMLDNPKYLTTKKPLCGIVPPGCTYTLTLTMPKQPPAGRDFLRLDNVMLGGYDLVDVQNDFLKYKNFFTKAKETTGEEVQQVTLEVMCDRPATESAGTPSSEPSRPTVEIITTPDAQQVSSIDVHPTEPWIVTTNHVGIIRIWNYHTMATLKSFQLVEYEPVHIAKFIARKQWVIIGDLDGGILVYNYENNNVESFDGHDSCITTLVVHPTTSFVLSSSSSDDDHVIKLWDWTIGWTCTRRFRGHTDKVTQVAFNPSNNDNFASASMDGTIKIWSISSDKPSDIITLRLDGQAESLLCVDYFIRYNRHHLIVGCKDKTAQIWALGIKGHVDVLEGHEEPITVVELHPELPWLMTGSLDGTVRIWDSTTYKPENIICFNLGAVYAFGCIKGSRRIVVGCHQGIAAMEISLS